MQKVILGIDRFHECKDLFKNKKVGLITNPTGIDSNFVSTIDIFAEHTNLTSLYSPEHGVRGNIQAGEKIEAYIDSKTGVKVWTLYGDTKRPTKEMLEEIDILVYDIQDIGSRLYTYVYTLAYCMQAIKEMDKEMVVFDRPNPVNGLDVEGNLVDLEFKSFIGLYPIPYRYGLTIGELALFFNQEFNINCNLTIIKMQNWQRDMYYDETGLEWILPSPNMPTVDAAIIYNGTCIFEGTNISEGRGTAIPFKVVGAPWLDAEELAKSLKEQKLPGIKFKPMYFTPTFSKHQDELCQGVELFVTDRKIFQPIRAALHLLKTIQAQDPITFEFTAPYKSGGKPMIDYNTGSDEVRTTDFDPEILYSKWQEQNQQYKEIKVQYHLY